MNRVDEMAKLSSRLPWNDMIKKFIAGKPKDVDGLLNVSAMRHRHELLKIIFSLFKFRIPEWWDMDYFLLTMFINGYVGVTDTDAGIVGLRCGYRGLNLYDRPTHMVFANPVLGNFERTIGVDGILWKLQYDYCGVSGILDRYSYMLAQCDASIDVNLMNTRVATIAFAENKAQAETYKKMYDDITEGKPLVVMKAKESNLSRQNPLPWVFNPVKEAYISDKLYELKRQIKEDFLIDIGINTINNRKKERVVVDEVNANNQEADAAVYHWYTNLSEGAEQINIMFDRDLVGVEQNFDNSSIQSFTDKE